MKIEILSEKENPLLKRREFKVKITHDAATPSISEIRKKITSKDIGKGTVIIDSFKSKHGSRETLGAVKVYQTKERALEIEPRHRLIKNELIEITEEKREEKPKEEAKPEKEKEEPKPEEVKEEPAEKPKKAEKESKPKEEPKPKEESKPREEPKPEEVKEEPAEKPKKEPKKAKEEAKPSEKPKDKSKTKEGE